jgi:hypothetical protein
LNVSGLEIKCPQKKQNSGSSQLPIMTILGSKKL